MNEVFETIYLRRSVRNYKPDDVSDEIIRDLIKTATYAPHSATRTEPRKFVVIKDRELIGRLSERAKKLWLDRIDDLPSEFPKERIRQTVLENPASNIFYHAPVLVFIYATPGSSAPHYDCATAAQNMMLAARSLGIGSCWIGWGTPLDADQQTRDELNVPEGYRLMVPLIFGYPAKDVETTPPRDQDVVLSWIE